MKNTTAPKIARRKNTRILAGSIAAVCALALLEGTAAQATNYYWDSDNPSAAGFITLAGAWNGVNNFWNTSSTGAIAGTFIVNPTAADDLFTASSTTPVTTAGTITLTGAQVASSFTFAANLATTVSGAGTLTIGGTGTRSGIFVNVGANAANTISSGLILNATSNALNFSNSGTGLLTIGAVTGSAVSGTQTITVGSVLAGAITLNGIIGNGGGGGNVGLTFNNTPSGLIGAGGTQVAASSGAVSLVSTVVTTLSGANTYTGTTTVTGGVLRLSNATALPGGIAATGGTSGLTINGGVVELANGNFLRDVGTGSAQFQITGGYSGFSALSAARTVTVNNNSAQELVWGTSTFAPTVLVLNETTANNTLNLTNKVDLNGATRTIAVNANTATVSGVIRNTTGTAGLTKIGVGTLVLNQTNTYNGPTTLSGGTLSVAASAHLGDAASNLVFNGGTLQITAGLTNFSTIGHAVVFNTSQTVGLDITGTFTADQALTNGVGGLTKAGAGTLVLNQANTYSGTTTISAGTLRIDDGGSIANSKLIVNNATLSFNRTSGSMTQGTDFSIITGTGAVNNAAAGTLVLSNVNTYSGTTTATAGTITVSHALALQNSALVTTGAGTVTLSGVATPTIGGLSGATGNLGTASALGAGYSSVTALTLNPNSGSVTYGGIVSNGSGAMTLTKTGAGTQILSGVNTYTGATAVNFGTLTIGSGTAGSLNGTVGTALTIRGNGTFNVAEAASSAQHMTSLALDAADATVKSTFAATAANLTFDAVPTRANGATGTFVVSGGAFGAAAVNANGTLGTNNIILTGQPGQAAMGVAYFAGTVSGTGYAFYDGAGFVRPIDYVKDTIPLGGSSTQAGGATIASNAYVQTTAAITAQNTATFTGLHIVNASNAAQAFTLAGGATVTTNGILRSGGTGISAITTISGGTAIQAANNAEMVIRTDTTNDLLTVGIPIQANGTSSLTKTGAGTVTFNVANTYTGGTVINGGTITFLASVNNPLGSGTTTVNRGGTLALNRNDFSTPIVLNGGTVTSGNSFTSTISSTAFTLNDVSTINVTGNLTISGNMSGAGGIIKTGGIVVPVTGTNSYTGPTTITGGALKFKTPLSLYNNTPASWTPTNITVGSGASLLINVGGSGEFSLAQAGTILSNLTTGVNNNGLQAGSLFGIDVANASGTQVFSANITDSSGPGGGGVGFRQFGLGTVELTGTNTYTGQTIADSNGTLRLTYINSVFTNAALGTFHLPSSSLGAPNTVANGTILLGKDTFGGANLTYLGSGETTDRVFNLGGGAPGGSTSYTFTQAGTGLLKLVSDFTITDNRGAKNITFTGSTTGTGEMAGVIPLGDPAGPSGVTKSGTGTWTLSGANLYTGNTTVSGGKLNITNATNTTGVFIISAGTTLNLASFSDYGVASAMGSRLQTSETNSGTDSATSGIGLHFTGGTLQYTGSTVQSTNRMIRLNNTTTNTIDASGTGSGTLTFTGAVAQVNLFDTGGTRTLNLIGSNTGNNTLGIVLTDQSTNATSLVKNGNGTWVLSGANTYTGTTTISAGTLKIGGAGVLGGGSYNKAINNAGTFNYNSSATQTLSGIISGAGTLIQSGPGTLTLTGGNNYTGGTTVSAGTLTVGTGGTLGATAGTLAVNNPNTGAGTNVVLNLATAVDTTVGSLSGTIATPGSGTNTATINNGGIGINFTVNQTTAGTYAGVIAGAGSFTLGSLSTNTLTLSGANTYTGGTFVNAGTLRLAGAVNLPATGTLQVNAGATFSLADGAVNASTTAENLNVVSGSSLTFDWVGGATDTLTLTSALPATASGNVIISLNPLSSPSGTGLTLLSATAGGGLTAGGANYLLANPINYTATLAQSDTAVTIGSYTNVTPLASAYWFGGVVTGALGAMALSNGTSNWASDAGGTPAGGVVPGSAANVFFSTTAGATQQSSVTLGSNMTVNSVTFDDTTTVTIGADGSSLTLLSAGTGAASAISTNQSATINAGVILGVSQTWTVANTMTLTVGGGVSGAFGLTKDGAGTVVLDGANTYTGGTTISAGTLQLGSGGSTGTLSTGSVIVNNGTFAINRGNTVVQGTAFSGAAITGSGGLVQLGGGTTTLNATNTYSGGTTISAGTLIASVAGALGTGNVANNGTLNLTAGTVTYTGLSNTGAGALSGSGIVNVTLGTGGSDVPLDGNYASFTGTWNIGVGAAAGANKVRMTRADNAAATINVLTHGGVYTGFGLSNVTHNASIVLNGGDTGESFGQLRLELGHVWAGSVTLAGVITGTGDGFIGNTVGNTGTISGIIGETGGARALSKVGDGTIILSNANTYTGLTTVNGGALAVGNNLALQYSAMNTAGAGVVTFSVTTPTIGGLTGAVNLATKFTTGYSSVTALTLNPLSGSQTYSGIIGNGAMTLTKTGAGTQTLSGANTYTGLTDVQAGTLALSGGSAIADTGAVNIASVSGAILNVSTSETIGSLAGGSGADGAVTLGANTLTVGDASTTTFGGTITGTLTTGTLVKQGAGVLNLATTAVLGFDTLTANAGTLNVNSALGTGTGTGVVGVSGVGTKLRFGSVSQTLSSLTIGAGSTVVFTSGTATGAFSGGGGGKSAALGGGSAVVPEPGTLGLLLVGALGMLNRRRRA